METSKNKKLIFLFIGLIIILAILSVFFALVLSPKDSEPLKPIESSIIPPERFKDCQILTESCKDSSCEYLSYCQSEGEYESCQAYDCGEYFGVVINKNPEETPNKFVKSFQKQTEIITEDKRDIIRQNCKGSVEIIEQKCENENNFIIKAKVNTEGECKIYRFTAKIGEDDYKAFEMEKAGDIYNLSLDSCLEDFELIAVGEMGISIK